MGSSNKQYTNPDYHIKNFLGPILTLLSVAVALYAVGSRFQVNTLVAWTGCLMFAAMLLFFGVKDHLLHYRIDFNRPLDDRWNYATAGHVELEERKTRIIVDFVPIEGDPKLRLFEKTPDDRKMAIELYDEACQELNKAKSV